jgi:hypothetical protein
VIAADGGEEAQQREGAEAVRGAHERAYITRRAALRAP